MFRGAVSWSVSLFALFGGFSAQGRSITERLMGTWTQHHGSSSGNCIGIGNLQRCAAAGRRVRCACAQSGLASARAGASAVAVEAGTSLAIMVGCVLCVSHCSCVVCIGSAAGFVRETRVLCGIGVERSLGAPGGARGRHVLAARAGVARGARVSAIPVPVQIEFHVFKP